jgi:hypothetical protein
LRPIGSAALRGNGSRDYAYITIPPDNPEMFDAMTEVIGLPICARCTFRGNAPRRMCG